MSVVAVIDIDRTIADGSHRLSALGDFEDVASIPQSKWDAYLDPKLLAQDAPVAHAQAVIEHMRKQDYTIVFLTGRNLRLMEVTENWLKEHFNYSFVDELIMRPECKKNVPASVYKEEVFRERILRECGRLRDYLFFEDDPYVIDVWKKYGMVFRCPDAWEHLNPTTNQTTEEPLWNL